MSLYSNCNDLDAYLSDDLSGSARAIFESHLEACFACRDAVDQQQWIDNLLHSPAQIELERPPAEILNAFHATLVHRRQRVMKAVYGLAAAATLLIAVGLWVRNRPVIESARSGEQSIAVAKVQAPTPIAPPATFVSNSDAIVVALESASADVTIVQVYPTTDTERRLRLELALSTNL